ncbi:protoporphyrinogen/coproporphyrinogen oxidase [Nocardioides sp. GXQ0305]|uniref:protoporphyrinogen/coproporphyrinogen oxidase n=1 Tax=Nocardioides sp. GXQ0305 TaxID=3423912 RepID=UPI003D7E25B2
MRAEVLVVGAGVSGLAFAQASRGDDVLVVEAADDVGGYCRTVRQQGFVWDYSGHFFHFRHPEVEAEMIDWIGPTRVRRVSKSCKVLYKDRLVDFPFQRNIDQLDHDDFVACLTGLGSVGGAAEPRDFKELLYARFGEGICERFLVPYNEKLYATDLGTLDVDAMGRFFPQADKDDILAGLGATCPPTYNSTFLYPEGGAVDFVRALQHDIPADRILLEEPVLRIDLRRHLAHTARRTIRYDALVSTVPLPTLLELTGLPHDPAVYTHNKVLVFNLGFDRKGPTGVHWIYVPDRDVSFYRVGFYDNIWETDRMSLYVEIGCRAEERLDEVALRRLRARVLADLERIGITDGHRLVASHRVVLDPAYVHITRASLQDVGEQRAALATRGVHTLGRYGTWTYCSLEDNIVEARRLAALFNRSSAPRLALARSDAMGVADRRRLTAPRSG